MRDIKLIALDLDGTLLDSNKDLSPDNLAALTRAAEAGIEIVPATGRFYSGMPEVIRRLPFVHYAITINGAQVYDIGNDRTVSSSELTWEHSLEIMRFLDTLPVIYDCYQDGWGWMTQSLYDQAPEYISNPHNLDMVLRLRTPVPDLKARIIEKKAGVQKVQAFFRDTQLHARMLTHIRELFPDTAVTSSIFNNIEINSSAAHKGNALRQLAAYLGLDMSQTMAFGDGTNDITMLQAAGIGVAMENAVPQVKEAADHITVTCDGSGVAVGLSRLLFDEKEGN